MRILVVGALFASLVGGCANFEAVSEFSRETNKLTETLRTEFVQLDSLCAKQAELVIVVNNIQDDGPLKDCEQYQAAQGRLAGVTVDVLDNYARALAALADNKAFDLSCDLKGVASELTGLKPGWQTAAEPDRGGRLVRSRGGSPGHRDLRAA
jgi:hypothetical protein